MVIICRGLVTEVHNYRWNIIEIQFNIVRSMKNSQHTQVGKFIKVINLTDFTVFVVEKGLVQGTQIACKIITLK